MGMTQNLTSQILPKISQTISGGSFNPSQPSDSFELSPDLISQLEIAKRSFKVSNFKEIQETDSDG